jgi:hypothetical protein
MSSKAGEKYKYTYHIKAVKELSYKYLNWLSYNLRMSKYRHWLQLNKNFLQPNFYHILDSGKLLNSDVGVTVWGVT